MTTVSWCWLNWLRRQYTARRRRQLEEITSNYWHKRPGDLSRNHIKSVPSDGWFHWGNFALRITWRLLINVALNSNRNTGLLLFVVHHYSSNNYIRFQLSDLIIIWRKSTEKTREINNISFYITSYFKYEKYMELLQAWVNHFSFNILTWKKKHGRFMWVSPSLFPSIVTHCCFSFHISLNFYHLKMINSVYWTFSCSD